MSVRDLHVPERLIKDNSPYNFIRLRVVCV